MNIADARGPETLATGDMELVERDVADPHFNPAYSRKKKPETVTVQVNIRESSIAQMHARGQIDDAQQVAADRFRSVFERAGLSGVQGMDTTRERVDGGQRHAGYTDTRLDAARELSLLARELGKIGYPVCILVCGERLSVRDTARRMLGQPPKKRELEYYGRLLRDHLDLLCFHWGYKKKGP